MQQSTEKMPHRHSRKKVKPWQRVLFHWRLPLVIVLILMILSGVLVQTISSRLQARTIAEKKKNQEVIDQLPTYDEAITDALKATKNEMHKLVSLTKEDGRVTYDEETDRVLLTFWTDTPDAFTKDGKVALEKGQYAYADLELAAWGKENRDILKNEQTKRLCKLFGLPANTKNTHFVLAWVTPERILRAAYQPDAQVDTMSLAFEEDVDQDFIQWFEEEIHQNYFTNPRPWTRLGYTYDWGTSGKDHYGLTEFVIPQGTKMTVVDVLTNEEAIARLRKGKLQ